MRTCVLLTANHQPEHGSEPECVVRRAGETGQRARDVPRLGALPAKAGTPNVSFQERSEPSSTLLLARSLALPSRPTSSAGTVGLLVRTCPLVSAILPNEPKPTSALRCLSARSKLDHDEAQGTQRQQRILDTVSSVLARSIRVLSQFVARPRFCQTNPNRRQGGKPRLVPIVPRRPDQVWSPSRATPLPTRPTGPHQPQPRRIKPAALQRHD
jgi:hypothetical protein